MQAAGLQQLRRGEQRPPGVYRLRPLPPPQRPRRRSAARLQDHLLQLLQGGGGGAGRRDRGLHQHPLVYRPLAPPRGLLLRGQDHRRVQARSDTQPPASATRAVSEGE